MRSRKNEVRIAVVGAGLIGRRHADLIRAAPRARLAALCSRHSGRDAAAALGCAYFDDARTLFRSGACDAVLIATPHYDHPVLSAAALDAGLHVLVEKPIAAQKADALPALAAARRHPRLVFAAMFQMRTDPRFLALRRMIRTGALGALQRVTWIITDWFRPDAYYAANAWRGTWAGEGGGVLLNQCPHQLDLLCWMCGLPERVTAVCGLGRRHRIEVEDEASALLEFPGGATGLFVASTGEAPGVNRLEVAGTRGRAILEGQELTLARNRVPSDRFCRTAREPFAAPPFAVTRRAFKPKTDQHAAVIRNFVDAILDGVPPVAPAAEGMASLELANAMLLSSLRRRPVDLPLDADAYARALRRLVRGVRASP